MKSSQLRGLPSIGFPTGGYTVVEEAKEVDGKRDDRKLRHQNCRLGGNVDVVGRLEDVRS